MKPVNFRDLAGKQFHRWRVISYIGLRKWRCICKCGIKRAVSTQNLTNGTSKSCGCFKSEQARLIHITHGCTREGTRDQFRSEYTAWSNIRDRCYNPQNRKYANYGGRGVTVCHRWRTSFSNFLSDMGKKPTGLTIERIDSRGNYEPRNCRWATWTEQQRNRGNNRIITSFGESLCVAEWAEKLGIKRSTINSRLNQLQWPESLALAPADSHRKKRLAV